jgi:hypothetical protein
LDTHVLKNENAAKIEEVRCLESRVLELKKDVAVEMQEQQQLRVTNKKAEAGTFKQKAHISCPYDGEGRKWVTRFHILDL